LQYMQHCQMSVDEKEREQVFCRLLEVNSFERSWKVSQQKYA